MEEKNELNICELYPEYELLVMPGYNDCIIGVVERIGQEPYVLYDKIKVIEKLMKDMTEEEAIEWYEYNILGGIHG